MVSYTLGIAGPLQRRVSGLTWRGESPTGIPLTTDGRHVYAEHVYAEAVEDRLGADIDYAMRVEIYRASTDNPDSRYSPPPPSDAVPTSRPIPRAFRITRMPSFPPCAPARWERDLSAVMPGISFRNMTDDDLKAIFAYLRMLQPVHHRVDNALPPTASKICQGKRGAGEQN